MYFFLSLKNYRIEKTLIKMRKLFFALSLVGMLMIQWMSYAKTSLNTITQDTEQQQDSVAEQLMVEVLLKWNRNHYGR